LRRAAYRIGFGVAIAAVAGIGWAVWRNARGVEAIRELCASQGGLQGTTNSPTACAMSPSTRALIE